MVATISCSRGWVPASKGRVPMLRASYNWRTSRRQYLSGRVQRNAVAGAKGRHWAGIGDPEGEDNCWRDRQGTEHARTLPPNTGSVLQNRFAIIQR